MEKFDFKIFNENIQKDFLDANRVISDLQRANMIEMLYATEVDDENIYDRDDEKEFNEARLNDIFSSMLLKFSFAYEYLQLPGMKLQLDADLKKHIGNLGVVEYEHYIDIFYSPVDWIFTKHIKALTSHVKIDENEFENTNSIVILERILRGTPKILFDNQIEPKNEAEVRQQVYNTLIHVFPDTVREIPIAKVSKTYKPDIGVKRLKCAVEYKFADTANEAKNVIGEIFEDIHAYAGSEDWKTFYAVIYMTDNFLTQDQVEADFKLSGVPHNWKPLVLYGKGSRPAKKKKNGA